MKATRIYILLALLMIIAVGCTKDKAEGDGTIHGHIYVDLGLPSGTLWAACNVGADSPEEYGDYFAWGETKPKRVYSLDTYKYKDSIPYSDLGEEDLRASDDAASANWAGGWHTPTYSDWHELCHETTIEELTMNGVKGICFKGTNGKSLFLPYAGAIIENELYEDGISGGYWASTSISGGFYQWLQRICDNFDIEMETIGYVYYGYSIRPVHSVE